MKEKLIALHHWAETIPDKLYPFRQKIEGDWVRGKAAYQKVLAEGIKVNGPGKTSYHLLIYRGTWHMVGSVLFIITVTFVAQQLLSSERALYVLMAAAIVALCMQEFLLQPKRYGQTTSKGVFDIFTWVLPMAVYVAFLIS